jgi:hypothetical protein
VWAVDAVGRNASAAGNRPATERVRLAAVRVIADELERVLGEPSPHAQSGLREQLADELELLARALREQHTAEPR